MDDGHRFTLESRDGTTLQAYYWPAQNPHATLALVHGFGEYAGRYQPMADYLTARGIEIIAIDLRGHGRSPGPRGVVKDYNDFRDDLAALLTRAQAMKASHNGPLVLFGHSMGGGLVLDHGLSGHAVVDGIIASAPLVGLAEPIPSLLEGLVRLMAKILPKAAMKQPIDGSKISTLAAEQRAYEADALNHGRMGLALAVGLVDTGKALQDKAGNWSLPLLVYHSDQDQLTDFEASQDFTTQARGQFVAFTGVEHEMHNDTSRPDVYALIERFIDQLAGRE
jgi:alpha-beta hydrolase superfamily lysophospholipase